MKNQIIDGFTINPEDKQKMETEISNMCSDMAIVQAMANDENAHGPMVAEIKKDIVQDIARDLSSLLEEKDSLKAIFVIAVNDDNQFRTIHAGEIPALTRVVMLTSVETIKLAQSLANEIRSCMTEQDGEDAPEVDNNATEAMCNTCHSQHTQSKKARTSTAVHATSQHRHDDCQPSNVRNTVYDDYSTHHHHAHCNTHSHHSSHDSSYSSGFDSGSCGYDSSSDSSSSNGGDW